MSEETNTLEDGTVQLAPRTGSSFYLKKGQRLTIIDPQGTQVSDIVTFNASDIGEWLSNGRSFDYANKIYFSTGDKLYSNRSNVMLRIVEDTVGTHDFLFTPCSKETFRIKFGDEDPHPGCFGNLAFALAKCGISEDRIPSPFNCFMNVPVDGKTGTFEVLPPTTKPGDHIDFVAEMDLIVGITACSAGRSNGGSFKPIQYRIE
ncbi:hypothetical protein GQ53DRAFT_857866 [Thozetella sp. PMI_491]|nr:hypothetical protein GQ53DRAFT_857866 [Thozetella sp. PMI_491]